MHARLPPRKVILREAISSARAPLASPIPPKKSPHIVAYTPGYFTPFLYPGVPSAPSPFPTASSSNVKSTSTSLPHPMRSPPAVSQRLGRHSSASSPQMRRLRFAPRIEMMTFVPAGTCTARVSSPVVARTGSCKGRTVSFVALSAPNALASVPHSQAKRNERGCGGIGRNGKERRTRD